MPLLDKPAMARKPPLFSRADLPLCVSPGLLVITQFLDDRHDLFVGDEASTMPQLVLVDGLAPFVGFGGECLVVVAELPPLARFKGRIGIEITISYQ